MRNWLLALCALQLITTLERQVFDFLGFMWAPILANFFNILLVIFGFFGVFQYVARYVISYAVWNLLWVGWNSFVVCFYLNVGVLNRDGGLLALGTGSVSWWEVNGKGCKAHWGDIEGGSWSRPTRVEGCLLHYAHVEVLHAAVQCVLGLLAFFVSLFYVSRLKKANNCDGRSGAKSVGSQSLYSVEFTRPPEIRVEPTAKPMTPRRVKRRSVSSRHSTRRSSRRSSHRRSANRHQNAGHSNPTYRQSSRNSLNDSFNDEDLYNNRPASVRSSYSNFHGARPISMHMDGGIFPEASYRNEGYLHPQTHPPSSPSPTEATPQVPQKRNTFTEEVPSNGAPYRIYSNQNSFLNNGPPAYHLHQMSHYSPPPDTETAM